MLPTGAKDKGTILQIIIYISWTVLISIIPAFGYSGRLELSWIAAGFIVVLGLGFLSFGFRLFKQESDQAARQLMLASVIYITILQLIYVIDKII